MQPLKTTILSLTLAAAAGMAAHAQNAAPAPNFSLPQAYNGYSQPEITDCKTADPTKRTCMTPPMTAGRYVITAAGDAVAKGADGVIAAQITLNGAPCTRGQSKPFTGTKSIAVRCVAVLLTDQPLAIQAQFAAQAATPDAKGPQIAIQRVPWSGVLEASAMGFPNPPAAAAKPAPKKPEAPAQ